MAAQLHCINHRLHQLPYRCLQQRHGQPFSLQPRQPQVQTAGVAAHSSFNSGSALPGSVQCIRQQSVVCRSWRRVYNGLTSGLNEPADEENDKPELDMSIKGRSVRFVERLYDWGIRSTDEKDALNTREQAPITWVDKASLAIVRALQTVIMLALAWHVYAWLSSSISLLIWRYSLAWPNWLTLK